KVTLARRGLYSLLHPGGLDDGPARSGLENIMRPAALGEEVERAPGFDQRLVIGGLAHFSYRVADILTHPGAGILGLPLGRQAGPGAAKQAGNTQSSSGVKPPAAVSQVGTQCPVVLFHCVGEHLLFLLNLSVNDYSAPARAHGRRLLIVAGFELPVAATSYFSGV